MINKRKLKEKFLDIIFPRFCCGCNREGSYICKECELFLTENELICPLCGNPNEGGVAHKKCRNDKSLDGLVSIWDYEGVIKKAISKAKRNQAYHITEKLTKKGFKESILVEDRYLKFLKFFINQETVIAFTSKKEEDNFKLRVNFDNLKSESHSKEIANYLAQIAPEEKEALSLSKIKTDKNISKVIIVNDLFINGSSIKKHVKSLKNNGVGEVWCFSLARKV